MGSNHKMRKRFSPEIESILYTDAFSSVRDALNSILEGETPIETATSVVIKDVSQNILKYLVNADKPIIDKFLLKKICIKLPREDMPSELVELVDYINELASEYSVSESLSNLQRDILDKQLHEHYSTDRVRKYCIDELGIEQAKFFLEHAQAWNGLASFVNNSLSGEYADKLKALKEHSSYFVTAS